MSTSITDPSRLAAIRTAMNAVADKDTKTHRFMERGNGFIFRGPSGNSLFADGKLTVSELETLKCKAEAAYQRLEPTGAYVVFSAFMGMPASGPHQLASKAIALIQNELDILGQPG